MSFDSSKLSKELPFFASSVTSVPEPNYAIRVINSFKRYNDDGTAELSREISGFSVQCIAVGGAIGTGLLIGSGKSLASGAAPLLVSYVLVSSFIFCMCQSLGELSVSLPLNGGFTNYSSKLLDKSWGFAMAWNYYLQWALLLPMELVAASITFQFWPKVSEKFPDWAVITVFFSIVVAMNLLSVKYYGLAEMVFAIIKVVAILFFVILAFLVDIGAFSDPIGFSYWKNPGVISPNGFHGVVNCIITAAFSFSGSELVGLAAAESKDPEITIPKATKQVFWRICGFYIVSLTIISLVVPFDHPRLVGSGNSDVNTSPFVLALSNIKSSQFFATAMNIVILISILSVGNSAIFASSRTLLALAENAQAPSIFSYIDRERRPLVATLVSIAMGFLAYISVLWPQGSETLFLWLMSLSGISVIASYATICACHLRFRQILSFNSTSLDKLVYKSQTGKIGSWYGITLSIVILLAQVVTSFLGPKFSPTEFSKQILGILVIVISYLIHKLYTFIRFSQFSFYERIDVIDIKDVTFKTIDEKTI